MLAAQRAVIHLAGVGVVLAVAVPDLALLDDAIEKQRFQLLQDVRAFNFRPLDFFFDVLFFVGQVLIQVAVALDVVCCSSLLSAASKRLRWAGRSSPKRSSINTLRLRSVALNS